MAMNASTGTLTSSWRKELIPSTLSRTKMDLVITTSAGQEKMNSNSRGHLQRDAHSHMLYDTETQTETRCPGVSSEEAAGCCGTTVM